jgi:hypothetical protein
VKFARVSRPLYVGGNRYCDTPGPGCKCPDPEVTCSDRTAPVLPRTGTTLAGVGRSTSIDSPHRARCPRRARRHETSRTAAPMRHFSCSSAVSPPSPSTRTSTPDSGAFYSGICCMRQMTSFMRSACTLNGNLSLTTSWAALVQAAHSPLAASAVYLWSIIQQTSKKRRRSWPIARTVHHTTLGVCTGRAIEHNSIGSAEDANPPAWAVFGRQHRQSMAHDIYLTSIDVSLSARRHSFACTSISPV